MRAPRPGSVGMSPIARGRSSLDHLLMSPLSPVRAGLRAHDIHQGLLDAEVDRASGVLASELGTTQLVGMAAALAAWIKGHEVVGDAQRLMVVASQQLDISPFVFDRVVGLLESIDFVWAVQRSGDRVTSFNESVPAGYERVFGELGRRWAELDPSEVEAAILATLDDLSSGPMPVEGLDLPADTRAIVLEVGGHAEAIRTIRLQGQDVAYTPFLAYERPADMENSLQSLDLDEVRSVLQRIRERQGMPLSRAEHGDTLTGLVGAGLIAAPGVKRPDSALEHFAIVPYGVEERYRTTDRPILDKALALVASVRMGEYFGGATSLFDPTAVLRKLLRGELTAVHSSSTRQYAVLHNMRIVEFQGDRSFTGIRLLDTSDNRTAVQLAIDLLEQGEPTQSRTAATRLQEGGLLLPGYYRSPIQTVRAARRRVTIPVETLREVIESAMGRRPVD